MHGMGRGVARGSLAVGLMVGVLLAAGRGAGARAEAVGPPVRVLFVLGSPPPHDIVKLPPILEGVLRQEYCHTFPDGVERHVIARFRERPANSKDRNGNRDVAWTREAGKGRVFYTALGHDEQSWSNPAWQRMMVQGILWSAGRQHAVTLPAAPR